LGEAMETLFPGSTQVQRRFSVEVVELAPDGTPAEVGASTVRGWEVDHACGAPPLALNIELDGSRFAYSGIPSGPRAWSRRRAGADLFAVEAYTFDRPVRYHLDYRTARAPDRNPG